MGNRIKHLPSGEDELVDINSVTIDPSQSKEERIAADRKSTRLNSSHS